MHFECTLLEEFQVAICLGAKYGGDLEKTCALVSDGKERKLLSAGRGKYIK